MVTRDPCSRVRDLFEESIRVKHAILDQQAQVIVSMAERAVTSLRGGGKMLLCGNGGSAADAQHLAAELLVRLRSQCNRGALPAMALALDTSSLTACANDFSFDCYYERMVRAFGRSGDILIGITTSGKSANVIHALRAARDLRMTTFGYLGCGGGPALAECDLALVAPSDETGRIQESHITAGHAMMELIEDLYFGLELPGTDLPRTVAQR